MLKRIITAIVAIILFFPVLYFSDTVLFPIVVTACALIAVFEMEQCIGVTKKWFLSIPAYLPAFLPLAIFFFGQQSVDKISVSLIMAFLLYFFATFTFSHGKVTMEDVSGTFFTVSYICAAFAALVYLRYVADHGKYLYLICFIGAWATDIFAYFCGRFFGKHKLIPDVSPKKTIEGSIGGTVFCVLSLIAYGLIVEKITDGTVTFNIPVMAISGLVVSIVSQIGDLLMSAVKRKFGIKDYGKLFPGHGGVLDRFDSVMAVAIALCIITSFVNPFLAV